MAVTTRGSIASVAEELGTRRARVLSRYGLYEAADRWDEAFGPKTPMAQAAPATCVSCAFLIPMAGSLKQAFGVCANEFGPADGHVVSLAYGCGGHSEAAVMPKPVKPRGARARTLHAGGRVRAPPGRDRAPVRSAADGASEDSGHSQGAPPSPLPAKLEGPAGHAATPC
ncbi:hypothetical protein SMICM17S_05900 [Streptomyces microflavus]